MDWVRNDYPGKTAGWYRGFERGWVDADNANDVDYEERLKDKSRDYKRGYLTGLRLGFDMFVGTAVGAANESLPHV